MPPPDLHTDSIVEVRRLVMRLVALKGKWPSEPTLSALSPRMINGLLAYNNSVEHGYFLQRFVFVFTCGMLLWLWTATHSFPCMLTFAVPIGLYWTHSSHASHRYRFGIYALTQTDDMHALPTLIQAIRYKWGRHPQALAAITRLLAHVTEEHVGLLNDDAQQQLWKMGITWQTLSRRHDHDIALRVLRALAAVGNQATLARMKRFVNEAEHLTNGRYVAAVARELLPLMEARLQRQEIPETLLRASDMPTSAPETLLRPAFATTPEPAEQLLRATRSEPGETPM